MKLLKKYRRYTYTSLIFVVLVGFTINYYLFRFSIHRTMDDVLNEYRCDIEKFAEKNGSLEGLNTLNNKFCMIKKGDVRSNVDETIVDTLVYSHYEKEMVVYRKIDFVVKADDGSYMVKLMLPTREEDDLLQTVGISLIVLVLLFVLFTTIIDRSLTVKILRPFSRILEVMRSYNIDEPKSIKLNDEGIDEYKLLDNIFNGMVAKINRGYEEMKDFLEHTSHEMKTPLAIIQLKLETLSQKNFEDEETIKCISSIHTALNRIVRFNRSLLFIAKIKNNQFNDVRLVNLNKQINQFMDMYGEILSERNITVDIKDEGDFMIEIHPLLAEQLIQNILVNATKYNYDEGHINIYSSPSEIRVTNTFEGTLPEGNLFEKYRQSTCKKDSSGLGLAIVKNICDKNNLSVGYAAADKEFMIHITKG